MKNLSKRLSAIGLAVAFAMSLGTKTFAGPQSDTGWMEDDQTFHLAAPAHAAQPKPASTTGATSTTSATSTTAGASGTLLKGGVTYCVPRGTPIKLKLATVPTFGMKLLNRDLEGKLIPAKLDEPITAKVTEDIYVDDNKVIPQGTVFYGSVTKILPPRRVGRPGSLVLTFKGFNTPDGRRFAFHAEADNFRKSTAKTKAKGFGIIAAHAAGGAVVGALVAYQIFGMQETIAMHGYNIAGGAAAGALMGTAVALLRHGPEAVLEPGDDLNMEIDTDMLVPAATAPTVPTPLAHVAGVDINIMSTKIIKDGLDGYQLRLKAQVENNSKRRLQSIDLFIEDDNGQRFPVVADTREESSDMLFTIDPYTSKLMNVDFTVEFPKLKRKLVWLDHDSRQVIIETKLP
jgi:hypothetical protein